MLMRDWLDRKVRLLGDIKTRNGVTHKAGKEFSVISHWRGRLTLSAPCAKAPWANVIRHVAPGCVELLPIPAPAQEE